MVPRIELNNATILAYVDGRLSAEEVLAVEAALAQDQDAQAIVAELRQCPRELLRDALNAELGQALSPDLPQRIRQRQAEASRSRRPPVLIDMTADRELYVRETLQDYNPTADDIRALEARLGGELGFGLRVPDLASLDLSFKRGRLLVTEGSPFAELVYLAPEGPPVVLCVFPSDEADQELTREHAEGLNLMYWSADGVGYAIIGTDAGDYLYEVSTYLASQLKTPQARDRLRTPQ